MRTRFYQRPQLHISFLDVLFTLVLCLMVMLALTLQKIEVERTKAKIGTQAEFVITLTWESNESNRADDIDLWVQDPLGNIVFFRRKDIGFTHLDRDDLGDSNDTVQLPDGRTVVIPTNQEIITIRGIIPGEWTVNLHMWSKKIPEPSIAKVKIEKLNPRIMLIEQAEFRMDKDGEEITVLRFKVTDTGYVWETDKTPKEIITEELARTGGNRPTAGEGE